MKHSFFPHIAENGTSEVISDVTIILIEEIHFIQIYYFISPIT